MEQVPSSSNPESSSGIEDISSSPDQSEPAMLANEVNFPEWKVTKVPQEDPEVVKERDRVTDDTRIGNYGSLPNYFGREGSGRRLSRFPKTKSQRQSGTGGYED